MKIRLLLIEDSVDDEVLMLKLLRKADLDVDCLRVEDQGGLTFALRETWDLVISDFNLPRFDAMRALAMVREAAPDLPFIIVSGVVGEETAVEAIKLGANDYVMKSNLTRLPQTILRELKDARLRRERRSLEEQVRHSQKMEAMGQLAASVAHDFNNLLTVMMNFTQFAHDDLPEGHSSRADLREVVECGTRAAVLTRQLLAFGRKSVADPQLLDLNEELVSCEKMLKRLLGPRIDYRTLPSQMPAWAVVDRGLIEQVLVNLVVNARDAMPDGGKLTVETALVEKHPTLSSPHVLIAITDTGIGMNEEVQRRIFEPFFTTKGPGRGTGLGLSTVASIIKQCNGDLAVYSAVGLGTTFKIYLPYAAEGSLRAPSRPELQQRGGSETVLLVEDQEPVRTAVNRALAARGYRVVEAGRPRDALALLESGGQHVDLVLTDLVLPEMTGKELVTRLRDVRPELAVLYMSGYAGGAMSHQGIIEPGTSFLQKPFTPEGLVHKVRVALDADRQGATDDVPDSVLTVLLVEHDPILSRAVTRFLRSRGAHVLNAATAEDAIKVMSSDEPLDVLISSDQLPGISGAELLFNVPSRSSRVLRILCTASEELASMLRGGPVNVLLMPAHPEALWELVATRSRMHVPALRRSPRPGHFWVKYKR